ncbi:hypothetical protein Fmac_015749 [Flemingia macrophylla]|uniref:Uncharacterized protein n=1 Tax=Flemingia macrophylla TaxID=520843 RepID=A0ABD1MFI3_9FABA
MEEEKCSKNDWKGLSITSKEGVAEWVKASWVGWLKNMVMHNDLNAIKVLHSNESLSLRYLGDDFVLITRVEKDEFTYDGREKNLEFWSKFKEVQKWTPRFTNRKLHAPNVTTEVELTHSKLSLEALNIKPNQNIRSGKCNNIEGKCSSIEGPWDDETKIDTLMGLVRVTNVEHCRHENTQPKSCKEMDRGESGDLREIEVEGLVRFLEGPMKHICNVDFPKDNYAKSVNGLIETFLMINASFIRVNVVGGCIPHQEISFITSQVFNLNLKESTLSATSPSTTLSCLSLPSSIKKPISEATGLSPSALLSLSFPISLSLHLVGDFPPDTPSHLSAFPARPHQPVPPDHSL